MRIVLDTNVWLSAVFWDGEANKIINKAINEKIKIIITKEILSEIAEVLNREAKFQKFIKDKKTKIGNLIRTILSFSILIETKSKIELIKQDPDDNIILEAALDGKADYILSYDKHLLNMLEFRKIKILEPREFLKLLR